MKSVRILAGATFALAIAAGSTAAGEAPAPSARCFLSRDFRSWKASDAETIYIRVGIHRYYHLDLAGRCDAALRPGAFLASKLRGSNWICAPSDWDLHVAFPHSGAGQACIVKRMTELSDAEAASLPKKIKP